MTIQTEVGADRAADLFTINYLETQLENSHIEIAQLKRALQNGRTIGTAIGILIERYGVSSREAFRILVRASQFSNRKVRDIAAELVHTGQPLNDITTSRPAR